MLQEVDSRQISPDPPLLPSNQGTFSESVHHKRAREPLGSAPGTTDSHSMGSIRYSVHTSCTTRIHIKYGLLY